MQSKKGQGIVDGAVTIIEPRSLKAVRGFDITFLCLYMTGITIITFLIKGQTEMAFFVYT